MVLLVSKSDVAPSKGGTLNEICTQAPTDLVQCYAGTGAAGYNGAATGQGLSFIYSHATSAGTPNNPVITDVRLDRNGLPTRRRSGEPLGPVLRQRRQRLHGGGLGGHRLRLDGLTAEGRCHRQAEQGRRLREAHLECESQLDEHEREDLDMGWQPVGAGRRRSAGGHDQRLDNQDLRD